MKNFKVRLIGAVLLFLFIITNFLSLDINKIYASEKVYNNKSQSSLEDCNDVSNEENQSKNEDTNKEENDTLTVSKSKEQISDKKTTTDTFLPPSVKVTLKNFISKSIKISWSKVKNIDGYKIYYSTSKSSEYKYLKTLNKDETFYVHKNLVANKIYYYKVVSYIKKGEKTYYSDFNVKSLQAEKKSHVKIELDPGHRGGKSSDKGAMGADRKTTEATMNDRFVKILKNKLEAAGYEVVLSRPLYKHCKFDTLAKLSNYANKTIKPDLFISVHHNASASKSVKGYAVYYSTYKYRLDQKGLRLKINYPKYNNGKTRYKVKKIKVNSKGCNIFYFRYKGKTVKKTDNNTRKFTVYDTTPSKQAKKSRHLALKISSRIKDTKLLNKWVHGVEQNSFKVITQTNMPAIMVEVGYISNKSEFKKMNKKKFRIKYCNAIVKGVNDYYGIK